jgi:Calpain family cysteine protease
LKIRNPWRTDGSYSGTWNDADPNWLEEDFAAQVGFIAGDDGIFYIQVEDFVNAF